jgi:hypothetical protein
VKMSLLGGTDGSGKRENRLRKEVLCVPFASNRWYSVATISGNIFEESQAASTVTV